MSFRKEGLIKNRTIFGAEMEEAIGKPMRDQVTGPHMTEGSPKVSTDTKKVSQNQRRGKSSTYVTASYS